MAAVPGPRGRPRGADLRVPAELRALQQTPVGAQLGLLRRGARRVVALLRRARPRRRLPLPPLRERRRARRRRARRLPPAAPVRGRRLQPLRRRQARGRVRPGDRRRRLGDAQGDGQALRARRRALQVRVPPVARADGVRRRRRDARRSPADDREPALLGVRGPRRRRARRRARRREGEPRLRRRREGRRRVARRGRARAAGRGGPARLLARVPPVLGPELGQGARVDRRDGEPSGRARGRLPASRGRDDVREMSTEKHHHRRAR